MEIFKSLKFKLTLVYSVILIMFCGSFIFTFNLALSRVIVPKAPPSNAFIVRFSQFSDRDYEIVKLSREHDLEQIRRVSLYSLIPLTLLSFVAGYAISDILLKPIENLNEQIKRKTTRNLGEKIEYEDNGDEVSQLTQSFNTMSSRLASSFEKQKEFVQNASHEIKTPLAIINANLDNALEYRELKRGELEKILMDSKTSVEFMSKLTEDLLLLSFVDNDIKFEKISLNKTLDNAIEISSRLIKRDGFKIDFRRGKDITINGNPTLVTRAFQNIIENSIKYSNGSHISIEHSKGDKEVVVILEDDGNGISQKYKEKIFERFFRVDRSRSRKTGGTGLGLAISKEIFQKHGGDITLEESSKGAKFSVVLPIIS
ncbi:HAMP domain-containing histidine kinase [Candidatus Dojkabacteria bacterium]|nr:HAMP domain-containing histidine kinase [Candidatus Dojkabacteria bacterium]